MFYSIFNTGFGYHWVFENLDDVVYDINFLYVLENLHIIDDDNIHKPGEFHHRIIVAPKDLKHLRMPIFDISNTQCKFKYTYEFRKRDQKVYKEE